MARVYLALSKKAAGFSKLVVLKVLRSSTTEDPELRRMFFDEARVAALLNHPNVVQTYEAGEDEGRLFLAMEYLEGKSLSALVASRTPREIPLEVHLRIIADMLEGLHYAHGVADVDGSPLDIIHRDVSPQNVLVTFSGQSKVVDFGIAKVAGSPLTQSGIIKGKIGYMAPEQIHNKNTDRRADVFAAGVMVWEAIARRRLVRRGEPEVASIARRMNGEDPGIRTIAPADTPEELLAICDKAMSPVPDQRHATALELHDALDRYLRKSGGADQKTVAEAMETAFGEDRRKTKAFVEEQLRIADDSSPLIDIAKHRIVTLTSPRAGASDSDKLAASAPSRPAPLPPILPNIPAPFLDLQGERKATSTTTPHAADVMPQGARSIATYALIGVGVAAVIVTLSLVISGALGSRDRLAKGAAGSAEPAPAPSAGPGVGTPTAAMVRLVVHTSPDAATLLIDDEAASVPYDGKVMRGAVVHLSAHAPGFDDYDRTLTLDADTNLDIALSRGAPAGASAASSKPDAAAEKRRKRAIDDRDPYRR